MIAGVVKLVDALDSKSSGLCVRVGSIPTSGTILDKLVNLRRSIKRTFSRTIAL